MRHLLSLLFLAVLVAGDSKHLQFVNLVLTLPAPVAPANASLPGPTCDTISNFTVMGHLIKPTCLDLVPNVGSTDIGMVIVPPADNSSLFVIDDKSQLIWEIYFDVGNHSDKNHTFWTYNAGTITKTYPIPKNEATFNHMLSTNDTQAIAVNYTNYTDVSKTMNGVVTYMVLKTTYVTNKVNNNSQAIVVAVIEGLMLAAIVVVVIYTTYKKKQNAPRAGETFPNMGQQGSAYYDNAAVGYRNNSSGGTPAAVPDRSGSYGYDQPAPIRMEMQNRTSDPFAYTTTPRPNSNVNNAARVQSESPSLFPVTSAAAAPISMAPLSPTPIQASGVQSGGPAFDPLNPWADTARPAAANNNLFLD